MRIKNDYKRTGYFWLPEDENHQVPGILSITDGGNIELEIIGELDDSVKAFNNPQSSMFSIVGLLEKDGYVTLEACFYKNRSLSFGINITKSLVFVHRAIVGIAYGASEPVLFDSLSFSFEGLDEWINNQAIKVIHRDNFQGVTIEYEPQDEITFTLNDDYNLKIEYLYTLPFTSSNKEAKVSQSAFLKLESSKETELDDLVNVAHKILNFFSFAMDSTTVISSVSAKNSTPSIELKDDSNVPIKADIFYRSVHAPFENEKIHRHTMLFEFANIGGDLERLLGKWLSLYEVIKPALDLYFAVRIGVYKYSDTKFLALAQGLETYHRKTSARETVMEESEFRNLFAKLLRECPKKNRIWLHQKLKYGNEINLGQRIKRTMGNFTSHFGKAKERNKLIRDIVTTRNYLTHYTTAPNVKPLSGREILRLTKKVELLFQLNLLKDIGFTSEEINTILNKSHRLREKLN